MSPAFSNALYYPFIDIKNSDWLKTAVLFWDSISTIVPESMEEPYTSADTQYLADIGFLLPIRVNSFHDSVVGIDKDFINIIESAEYFNYVVSSYSKKHSTYHESAKSQKEKHSFSKEVTHISESIIYAEKLSYRLRHLLHNFTGQSDFYYFFEEDFARLYMITLANKISESNSIALVTDNVSSISFSDKIRYSNITPIHDFHYRRNMPSEHFKQGLLLDLIINDLRISPNTDLESIINFKKEHRDELGLFHTQLIKLTQGISHNQSIEVLRQEINDLYANEFLPAYNNFKRALNGSRIKWFSDNFFKISLFSTSVTSIPMAVLGLPIQQALLAGAGVSLLASTISYSVDKKQVLHDNPYSYLMFTEKQLGSKNKA